jgi:chorismate dehydratase
MIVNENASSSHAAASGAVAPVRLGVIDYLNVRPVYDWILRNERTAAGFESVQTVTGVPAAMNKALVTGGVDISNVSSFAYGGQASNWLLIPRLSVAAHGQVDSVLLFSFCREWAALDRKSIALTDQSATSAALVRVLSEQRHGIRPRYVTMASDLDTMLAHHDAALMIGDRALVERHLRRSIAGRGQPYCFDLAAEWTAWTGLPFVFAVWAGRADRVASLRQSGVVDLLRISKERGLARLDGIAAEYARRLDLPPSVCAEYLRLLDYDLGACDLEGLRQFLEMTIPDFRWTSVRFFED